MEKIVAKSDISQAQTTTRGALESGQRLAGQNLTPATAGYSNFATTGGVTPGEQALTKKAAQSNVSSIFGALKANLERQKAIQGGYSPGFGANERALGREAGITSSNAVNQADLGLLEMIRQGKLAGLGGLTNIGGLYQGQVPQLLGIGSNLAQAKPGWMDMLKQGLGLAGDIGSAISGAFPGSKVLQAVGGL